jgi:PGF-CTERM protein
MTKRFTLALIAAGLVLFLACMPVFAEPARPGNEETVMKGYVTIIAKGDQNYALGDTIELSGDNTASDITCLFLTGPGLVENGSQIQNRDPAHSPVEDTNPVSFQLAGVTRDNTWYWKWNTANQNLQEGTYTIYAAARPHDWDHMEKSAYGTVSVTFQKSPGAQANQSVTISPTTPHPSATRITTMITGSAPVTVPPASPGFGALMAIIGLGAVSFTLIRKQ